MPSCDSQIGGGALLTSPPAAERLVRLAREFDCKKFGPRRYAASAWNLNFVQPIWILIGQAFGLFYLLAPRILQRKFDLGVCARLGGRRPASSGARRSAAATPLFLTSHPPTDGPRAKQRFELTAAALELARAVSGKRPTLVLAIDRFALNTLGPVVSALYAGFVSRVHLAVDREPSERPPILRWLLRKTHFSSAGWRLLKELRAGRPTVLAPAGAVAHNARLIYAVRDWARENSSRQLEFKLAERLAQFPADGNSPLETGKLPADFPAGLSADFWSEVPPRRRLWKILEARIVRRGRAIALYFLRADDSGVQPAGEPVLWTAEGPGWQKISEMARERLG